VVEGRTPGKLIHKFILRHLDRVWTLMMGKVVQVDKVNMRCKVRMKLLKEIGSQEIIVNVPVIYPRSGGNVILTPIAVDDVVLVGFSKFALGQLMINSGFVYKEGMYNEVQFSQANAMVMGGFILDNEIGNTIFDTEVFEIPEDKIVMIAQGPVTMGKYLKLLNLAGDPGTPTDGMIWRNGAIVKVRTNGLTMPLLGNVYGEIWAHGVADVIVSVALNDWDQIVAFDTNGESNATIPEHVNSHIKIVKPGVYRVAFGWSGYGPATAHDWEFYICKNNNGTCYTNIVSHVTTPTTQKTGTISCSGFAALLVDDTVELWVKRISAGNNINLTTVHCTISLELAGA